jgi:hypothetical protein
MRESKDRGQSVRGYFGEYKMSYDFTPNQHVGMTSHGYYLGRAKKRKIIKPKQIAQHLNNWLAHLENLMDQGDVKAEKMLQDFYETKARSRGL